MDGWMAGCMDGWMDGCMYVCMYVCMYQWWCCKYILPELCTDNN